MDMSHKRIAKMVGANEQFILGRIQGRHVPQNDREFQVLHSLFLRG